MDSRPPLRRCLRASPGLPGPSTRLSSRALPTHPGTARYVQVLVTSASVTGFSISGSLAGCHWFNEAESGSLVLGSRLRSLTTVLGHAPGCIARPDRSVSRSRLPFHAGPELHGERAIHMADTSQSARRIRVTLAHRSIRRFRRSRIPVFKKRFVAFVAFVSFVPFVFAIWRRPGPSAFVR